MVVGMANKMCIRDSDKGHYEYIYKIFTDWQLPDNFGNQFYHPPLHHFLAACMLKISQIIGFGLERSYEGLQLLTAFYSFVIMVVACKIFYEIGLKGRALLLAAGIMAVHPTFLILGGSLNLSLIHIYCGSLYLSRQCTPYQICRVQYGINML